MNRDHLAQEAARLKTDPIFNKALDDIRTDALVALVVADADDRTTILRLQQRAQVVEEIRVMLDRYILAVAAQETASPFV